MTDEEFFITQISLAEMTWSFSRLDSFDECKYAWKLHYLDGNKDCGSCFSDFGLFSHKLLERLEKGELDIFTLPMEYKKEFNNYVVHDFPKTKYGDMRDSYYDKGLSYFSSLTTELDDKKILGVEEKVEFSILDKPFVGFIDLRYKDADGKMVFEDHKSSSMKLLKSGKPSKTYQNKMKHYEYQQYLYTIPFVGNGVKVDRLRWNFLKEGFHYEIPWTEEGYNEALDWAKNTLKSIESADNFDVEYVTRNTNDGQKIEPKQGYMWCHFICGMRDFCDKKEPMFLNGEII